MLVSPSSLQAAWKIYLRFAALCQAVRIICGLVHMVYMLFPIFVLVRYRLFRLHNGLLLGLCRVTMFWLCCCMRL